MFSTVRSNFQNFGNAPALHGTPSTRYRDTLLPNNIRRTCLYREFGKRLFDITLVLLSLPIVLSVVLLGALLVARDGHNPFYSQERIGRGGRVYTMWKLRSMVPNAKTHLEAYLKGNPEARAEWDSKQKLSKDPRITKVGRILRKTSMDELPQLWNVLIGDMSLVGPRPMMPEQKPLYPGRDYYTLLPGITGTWQVSTRNESTFTDRACFDSDYCSKLSFSEDLRLLAATVRVVLRGTGC